MKKTSTFVAMVLIAAASFASVQINWENVTFLSGLNTGDGTDEAPYTFATQDGFKLVWDLVYTADNTTVAPTWDPATGEIALADNVYGEGTQLLSRRTWEKGSDAMGAYDQYPASTPSTDLVLDLDFASIDSGNPSYASAFTQSSGGIYAAIFQYIGDENQGKIYWAVTDVLSTSTMFANEPPSLPDDVSFVETYQPLTYLGHYGVPEPATMGLLGLGALSMVLRRKLRK